VNNTGRNWETGTGTFLKVLQRPLGDTRSSNLACDKRFSNLASDKQQKKKIAARPLVPPGQYG
jgi:hypothetical protein